MNFKDEKDFEAAVARAVKKAVDDMTTSASASIGKKVVNAFLLALVGFLVYVLMIFNGWRRVDEHGTKEITVQSPR